MARKTPVRFTSTGLKVTVKKDPYTWLWNVKYHEHDGVVGTFAGPFKTMREAIERMDELTYETDPTLESTQ